MITKSEQENLCVDFDMAIKNPSEPSLRKLFSKYMKLYYTNTLEYHKLKNYIFDKIDIKKNPNINVLAFYCCIASDMDVAINLFSENIFNLSDSWVDLILSGTIGRNPDIILSLISANPNLRRKKSIIRYLISDKCGYSISEVNNYPTRRVKIQETPKEPLRIALMISGQIRGAESAKRTLDRLLSYHHVDYYVDTWIDNKYDISSNGNFNRIYPANLKTIISRIKKPYLDEVLNLVTPPDSISHQYIKELYGENTIINLEDSLPSFTNHERMYYKINSCFKLVSDINSYDLLIRIRPDLAIEFNSTLDLSKIANRCKENSKLIFAEYGYSNAYYGFGVDDKLAIGSPASMKIYCEVWCDEQSNRNAIGHSTLANHLLKNEVDVISLRPHVKTFFCNNK